jgi:hypothetical protein
VRRDSEDERLVSPQRPVGELLECRAPRPVDEQLDREAARVQAGPAAGDRRAAQLSESGAATAAAWSASFDTFAATLFADLKTPELGAFVTGLDRVLARLADAAPARAADPARRQ